MILLYVLSEDKEQMEEIAEVLLSKHWAMSVNIDWERDRFFLQEDKMAKKKVNLLTCVTKALLFPKIDALIREMYPASVPEVFTSPIINIDWDMAQTVIENTEKI